MSDCDRCGHVYQKGEDHEWAYTDWNLPHVLNDFVYDWLKDTSWTLVPCDLPGSIGDANSGRERLLPKQSFVFGDRRVKCIVSGRPIFELFMIRDIVPDPSTQPQLRNPKETIFMIRFEFDRHGIVQADFMPYNWLNASYGRFWLLNDTIPDACDGHLRMDFVSNNSSDHCFIGCSTQPSSFDFLWFNTWKWLTDSEVVTISVALKLEVGHYLLPPLWNIVIQYCSGPYASHDSNPSKPWFRKIPTSKWKESVNLAMKQIREHFQENLTF